ncbi:hypothetical protein COLO4_24183 [Corchorus olitorius]|uniref:Uncharacterized protein n=1 Tax=Corchorus olitorius TaxID=93759 RepID=A0A1R3ICA4_9ROSI|nr:hypothetical protein COLO4_24183 [Corchorus olitorius]
MDEIHSDSPNSLIPESERRLYTHRRPLVFAAICKWC